MPGHLVLLGRRGETAEAQPTLDSIRRTGTGLSVFKADASSATDMADVFAQVRDTLSPLAGIFHTAGVLDDGTLQHLTPQSFEKVAAPKEIGTLLLHEHSLGMTLDYFVLFSSVSSLVGSPGQANYCAANAFMDAFAHHRRALGLPA